MMHMEVSKFEQVRTNLLQFLERRDIRARYLEFSSVPEYWVGVRLADVPPGYFRHPRHWGAFVLTGYGDRPLY